MTNKEYNKKLKELMDYAMDYEGGAFTHNVISMKLKCIANDYGAEYANKMIDDGDLDFHKVDTE